MNLPWLGLLIEIIIWSFFSPFIEDTETSAFFFISINFLLVIISCVKYKRFVRNIFFIAYILRILAMLWDVYASDIFLLPNSGGDALGFFYSAEAIASNIELLATPMYGGLYTKIIGSIFAATGVSRLIGQYINVLLGITTLVVVYKTLLLLKVSEKNIKRSLFILAIFPSAVILSGIFLREELVTTLASLSVYFFVKWYCRKSYVNMILSILILLFASSFHAGIIGVLIGYMFFYMFYNHHKRKFSFSYKSIGIFLFFVVLIIIVATQFSDVLLVKFVNVDQMDDIYAKASGSLGESAYLPGIQINSFSDVFLYGTIKMFYFLFSPLPMDWRNLSDIIAFILDGLFYLSVIVFSLINIKELKKNHLAIGLILILLATSFIFGLGTSNAGTAMRHRQKLFPIFIVFFVIVLDMECRTSYKIKSK